MNIKEIRELIELIEGSAIEEFEMERSGVRIRIRKTLPAPRAGIVESAQQTSTDTSEKTPTEEPPKKDEENYLFKAPIVGTFYITPKPDAQPYVKVGDHVTKGTVLCTIEAMKIFNQIECDIEGEIIKILVENGQPVEYGQPLCEIRLTS
ncbi:acetyl-CoA carboxylase biotin carboxyl carrier protein [Acidobacteria bacterium AH-259-O06]|nr:acetyl-CoA carboxylase biotin carboxyl carrier protein [Acidobacteria bacterium AH-259-O06]